MTISEQLEQAVRELAAEDPDFIYTKNEFGGCNYFPDEDNPQGCIIGAALRRTGLASEEQIKGLRGRVSWVYEQLGFTEDCPPFLARVQAYQDGGHSWGSAVKRADADGGDPMNQDAAMRKVTNQGHTLAELVLQIKEPQARQSIMDWLDLIIKDTREYLQVEETYDQLLP